MSTSHQMDIKLFSDVFQSPIFYNYFLKTSQTWNEKLWFEIIICYSYVYLGFPNMVTAMLRKFLWDKKKENAQVWKWR